MEEEYVIPQHTTQTTPKENTLWFLAIITYWNQTINTKQVRTEHHWLDTNRAHSAAIIEKKKKKWLYGVRRKKNKNKSIKYGVWWGFI